MNAYNGGPGLSNQGPSENDATNAGSNGSAGRRGIHQINSGISVSAVADILTDKATEDTRTLVPMRLKWLLDRAESPRISVYEDCTQIGRLFAQDVQHGRVDRPALLAHTRAMLTARGLNSDDVLSAFDAAIDDMIAFTAEYGLSPAFDSNRLVNAGDFVFDEPDDIPAVWGDGEDVLWAEGEGFMVAGHQGTGKSTLVQQLVLHRAGIRTGDLLGFPVPVDERPTLYLAMDRPRQIARSMRRMVAPEDRELFSGRVKVWRGPLPFSVLSSPQKLADWVEEVCPGCGLLVADSVKDFAPGISKDDVGAALNSAWQEVIARGIELALIHHERKADQKGGRTHALDDIYGSTWLTSGLGSVFVLDGNPGDAVQELRHLKQPAACIGPLNVRHDHETGTTTADGGNRTAMESLSSRRAYDAESAVTAKDVAQEMFNADGRNEAVKAGRALGKLVGQGLAVEITGVRGGAPTRWHLSEKAVFGTGGKDAE